MKVRRALVAVHDTTGLSDFVRSLQDLGIEVVAGDGNDGFLAEGGVHVRSVEQHIGAKALAGGGTVKTLHPQLTSAILWGTAGAGDLEGLPGADDAGFDIVVVNLKPFERTAARRDSREEEILDAIDIDGPGILRAAAKNFERVLVVADPEVYPIVLDELKETDLDPGYDLRRLLASRAFDCTAHYELAIANWFSEVEDFPTYMLRDYVKMFDLPHGENPHQRGAYYVDVGARRHLLSMVEQLQGDELSFNNLNDLHVARGVIGDFSIPACTIVKHASPMGVSVSGDVATAFRQALATDQTSAQGGVVAVNRWIDADTAREIAAGYFEVVFAPAFTDEAREILAAHSPHTRVLLDRERRKKSPGERDMRRVIGGLLVQDTDSDLEERDLMDVVSAVPPTEAQWGDLLFAWRVAKWVPSNALVLGRELRTVGIGGCNPSRRDGLEFALKKAGGLSVGAMMASDAFLSHGDAVQLAIEAGIAGIIQPGGSDRDDEVVELADAAGIPMVFTHRRHFRH